MKRKNLNGLSVLENLSDDNPVVVFVHGAMDKGAGFLPVTRYVTLPWISYDRRGYGKSATSLASAPNNVGGQEEQGIDIAAHCEDLRDLLSALNRPVVLVGHSLGGIVALGAATQNEQVRRVVVFEPPLSWLSWWPRTDPTGVDVIGSTANETVDRFMERVIGVENWQTMPDSLRQQRYADGPALMAELSSLRQQEPFDPSLVRAPLVIARGSTTADIRLRAIEWLEQNFTISDSEVIEGAGHLAHRSHPKEFAEMVQKAHAASSVEP